MIEENFITFIDLSNYGETKMKNNKLKIYEIWIGDYSVSTGDSPPTKPEYLGKIKAPNFKVACFIYELRRKLRNIEGCINGGHYVSEQACQWFYNFNENRNHWTGKYYQNEDEAQESFKR